MQLALRTAPTDPRRVERGGTTGESTATRPFVVSQRTAPRTPLRGGRVDGPLAAPAPSLAHHQASPVRLIRSR